MKKYNWIKVAEAENEFEFSANGVGVIEADGKKMCVARYENEVFAFAFTCPHAGGLLADGYVDALGNVVCPTHRYKYSIKSGRNTSGEGFYLKTFPIEKRTDGFYVGIETNWLFNIP